MWMLTSHCWQGQAVGSAAHLVALRREAIGKYNVRDAWTVQQLTEQMQQQKQNHSPQEQHKEQQKQEPVENIADASPTRNIQ